MFLLCELNDENYTDASYDFFCTQELARKQAVLDCVENFEGNCRIETQENGFRVVAYRDDSFYIADIKVVDTSLGDYFLLWHHAYDDVDFAVRFQGTYDECVAAKEREIKNLAERLNLTAADIQDNVVDTGDEWEVWDIVKMPADASGCQ